MTTTRTPDGITTITTGDYTARVAYDTQDPTACGWHATYLRSGEEIDDSEQIGHPDMPIGEGAEDEAIEIARAHLAALDEDEPAATVEQIEALRAEASAAGDVAQVDLCTRALTGDAAALFECARAITRAAAMGA